MPPRIMQNGEMHAEHAALKACKLFETHLRQVPVHAVLHHYAGER